MFLGPLQDKDVYYPEMKKKYTTLQCDGCDSF